LASGPFSTSPTFEGAVVVVVVEGAVVVGVEGVVVVVGVEGVVVVVVECAAVELVFVPMDVVVPLVATAG
jgi:hypothetical protein